ncbi:hypothetical protein U6A24_19815 [Aquimarina gracilis]|uniref:Endosialidase-like protein n=1 Tax=Aquimarina gracilis TaxID=874422 RepID=A0ABU6A0U2_9FLAO|nr:hypothetical protein [Aquimarina gracilis]MEB3347734.1 hypothetical protein [Aquimarina gracilis]
MKNFIFSLSILLTSALTAQQTNTFPVHGSVGIGTMNPQEKLEVTGKIYLNSGPDDDGIYWARHNMTMGTIPGSYNHNNFKLKPGGSSQGVLQSVFQMYTAASETNHAEKIRIHTSGNSFFNGGNVGIGTTNPQEKLEVKGKIYLNSGPDDDGIYWARHNMTMGTIPGSYNHNNFKLKPGGSSQGVLQSVFQMYTAASETNHAEKIRIHTSGNSFFNGGNVGIGTTNPQEKLEVTGKIYLNSGPDDDGIYWARHNMTMGTIPGSYNHNNFKLKPGGSSQGVLQSVFQMYTAASETNHAEKIRIHTSGNSFFNGGNVGIGTTTPDSKLTVKGKIHAEEVKIDLSVPAPDYVFKKEYDLLTIDEVQQHIQEKGHLPNIPSAKVMEAEGVDLGAMNMKLLEKIEELTLYTIEQENRIKQLEQKMNSILQNKQRQ